MGLQYLEEGEARSMNWIPRSDGVFPLSVSSWSHKVTVSSRALSSAAHPIGLSPPNTGDDDTSDRGSLHPHLIQLSSDARISPTCVTRHTPPFSGLIGRSTGAHAWDTQLTTSDSLILSGPGRKATPEISSHK